MGKYKNAENNNAWPLAGISSDPATASNPLCGRAFRPDKISKFYYYAHFMGKKKNGSTKGEVTSPTSSN